MFIPQTKIYLKENKKNEDEMKHNIIISIYKRNEKFIFWQNSKKDFFLYFSIIGI